MPITIVTPTIEELCRAIIGMADLAFFGTDFIGDNTQQTRALIVPLRFRSEREHYFAGIFLYRGYGFTTLGIDCGARTPQERVYEERKVWQLRAHNVTGWKDTLHHTLLSICGDLKGRQIVIDCPEVPKIIEVVAVKTHDKRVLVTLKK